MDDTEENFGSVTDASSNEIKMGEDLDDFSHIYGIDGPDGMTFREYSSWSFIMNTWSNAEEYQLWGFQQ